MASNRIDMKHGFMKSIIKNQVDRDNYEKVVRETKPTRRGTHFHHFNNRSKKPDAAVYVPPKGEDWEQPDTGEDWEQPEQSSEEDDMPQTLFRFEFEDKDGQIYKQYVQEGVKAEVLAMRMGYDRKLSQGMIKALEEILQNEIEKRTKS